MNIIEDMHYTKMVMMPLGGEILQNHPWYMGSVVGQNIIMKHITLYTHTTTTTHTHTLTELTEIITVWLENQSEDYLPNQTEHLNLEITIHLTKMAIV